MTDPAFELALHLESLASTKGAPAALAMAEALIVAGTASLIRERGGRYAYDQVQQLADGIALRVIARRGDLCGNG